MTERFAIYFAPARDSALWVRAAAWLKQDELRLLTVSARRYGFHATLKAPMALKAGRSRTDLEQALAAFARQHRPVPIGVLAPRLIEGFVALTVTPQPDAITDFAANVVKAFDAFRAPLEAADRARRLQAPLSSRQVELLDRYGYPYVLEQFQLHMTLTDRLPQAQRDEQIATARRWFAGVLAEPVMLDRLVLFTESEPGAAFVRRDDYLLQGSA